uniref:Uncharacterized protein n=1 Tax=Odontella aurita TaxID=265563 RepID=A0A7S4JN07_9STRA|mmetsp:Transcript_49985/g.150367  ORF Transcript_49985/g.150367 Transcript_49985/m.150367 type:complete len:171 (+) Transcript_49985:130-642(+)
MMIRATSVLRSAVAATRRQPSLRSVSASATSSLPKRTALGRSTVGGGLVFPRSRPHLGTGAAAESASWRHLSASSSLSEDELRSRLDEFQDLFVEARLSIEDCADSADTTYFDEEAEAAKEAVDEAVSAFDTLIGELDEETKGRVMRQNGLKVAQLKGELDLVLNGGHAH